MTRTSLAAAALLLAACNTNVDPQFRVDDVRIMAVRSGVAAGAAADVQPGDTLVLDALVANPLGRPGLAVQWFGCLPTPDEAVSPCSDLATLSDPSRLVGNPSAVFLGSGARVEYTIPPLTDALAFAIRTAQRQPTYACRLYAELVVVIVAAAEGKRSVAVKSVRVLPTAAQLAAAGVTSYYALNHNPKADDVRRAPSDPDTCTGGSSVGEGPFPEGKTVICGVENSVPGTYTVDRFNLCNPDGSITAGQDESLSWQWYATGGDFPDVGGVGNARGDHVDFTRPPGAFTLWGILRDGRGGADWVSFAVSAL